MAMLPGLYFVSWGLESAYFNASVVFSQIFKGNQNSYDVSDHILNPAIIAKYIRINPTSWKNDICLRVEYYGCDGKAPTIIEINS